MLRQIGGDPRPVAASARMPVLIAEADGERAAFPCFARSYHFVNAEAQRQIAALLARSYHQAGDGEAAIMRAKIKAGLFVL